VTAVDPQPGAAAPGSAFEGRGGWPAVLGHLTSGLDIDRAWAHVTLAEVLAGRATTAQLAAFVVALRMKGERIDEINGLIDAMREAGIAVELPPDVRARAVDIVGTGGDRHHSINVSTLAALVTAGAGVPVCKHGSRAASSSCGAADLLEALGVNIEVDAPVVAASVAEAGMGFCFAQRYHPALRQTGPTRRELGIPTTFNVLGPMANPAGIIRQVVGVGDPTVAERMVRVLRARGSVATMVVHGGEGLDEISTTTATTVWRWDDAGDQVVAEQFDPAAHGIARASLDDLRGGPPATNAAIATKVLGGDPGPASDIVVVNAAAGLMVGGRASTWDEGIALARESLASGAAMRVLERMVEVTHRS
jgi:anthranilate phosphoribosyltransferase